jgi:uncharacterized membrane protein
MDEQKEWISVVKKESLILLYLFIALVVIFKIVFYNEGIWTILRTVFGIFWLYLLPGFSIMYLWREKLDFLERLIFGTVLGMAIAGLSSYYITLFTGSIRYQFIIIPILAEIVAFILLAYQNRRQKQTQEQ